MGGAAVKVERGRLGNLPPSLIPPYPLGAAWGIFGADDGAFGGPLTPGGGTAPGAFTPGAPGAGASLGSVAPQFPQTSTPSALMVWHAGHLFSCLTAAAGL